MHRLKEAALFVPDPAEGPRYTRDSNDDDLIAAAKAAGVPLVSGDRDLLALSNPPPIVLTPAAFLGALKAGPD